MKLDLTELNKGIEEEFVKKAAPMPTVTYNGAKAIPRAGAAAASAAGRSLAPRSLAPIASGVGGAVAKKIPIVSGLVHGGMAINDARQGDWTGAAINAGAGVLGLIPHPAAQAGMWGLDAVNLGRQAIGGVKNYVSDAMGTVGKYAPLLMGGLMLMSRKNNQQQQMPYPPYPPYYGPRQRSILDTTNMDPHSLGAPQMFAEKLAAHLRKKAGIVDAFAGAVGRKAVDSVVNAAAPSTADVAAAQKAKEKELELTSKYPEIEHMLENAQNKAYLEKLLKA
jgi:hypothetical protein